MKRRWIWLLYALAMAAALVAGSEGSAEEGREATIEGTVVDLHCYVTHGKDPVEHAGCSNACIARGVPAGFLAKDGTLYLLMEEKPFSVKERVAGMAGIRARAKGKIVERAGMKGLQVTSIEKL
jgi:hypothetical protein